MNSLCARDIMNPNVITVTEEMTVRELASLFTEKMISGAPVENSKGKLVGVVSLSDLARNNGRRSRVVDSETESDYYLHGWEESLTEEEIKELRVEFDDDLTVSDIMTPLVFKVEEHTDIREMADIMIAGRIHRLIVTRDDQIVGIISTLDMLKALRATT